MLRAIFIIAAAALIGACNSSTVEDLVDSVDDPSRRPIDTARLGTNAFVNDGRFGSIAGQFREVRDVIKLDFVRVLFEWNDAVHPNPNSEPNFGFYDDIARSIPQGLDAVVVVTGLPTWMQNSANWSGGNPRRTFAEQWVRRLAARYQGNPRIIAWQIWNEPNDPANPNNAILGILNDPSAYTEMLGFAHGEVKRVSGDLVINAATTAINQNYPESIDYNKAMVAAGALNFVDRFAAHYYGKQIENVVRGGGVADFLNSLGKGIWITESGAQGVNSQLSYGEQIWPYLIEKIPGIERIYQYQFTDAAPADVSYGMRTVDPALPVSDLYVHLRDRG